jgi:hypothetical protein
MIGRRLAAIRTWISAVTVFTVKSDWEVEMVAHVKISMVSLAGAWDRDGATYDVMELVEN